MSVIGAPGADMEMRRATCVDETGGTCFLVACSADEGVETESDDAELDDVDILEKHAFDAPFVADVVVVVAVRTGVVGTSEELSLVAFSLLGDETLTAEGEMLAVSCSASPNGVTGEACVDDVSSRREPRGR